jgi:hypothetical protein
VLFFNKKKIRWLLCVKNPFIAFSAFSAFSAFLLFLHFCFFCIFAFSAFSAFSDLPELRSVKIQVKGSEYGFRGEFQTLNCTSPEF